MVSLKQLLATRIHTRFAIDCYVMPNFEVILFYYSSQSEQKRITLDDTHHLSSSIHTFRPIFSQRTVIYKFF